MRNIAMLSVNLTIGLLILTARGLQAADGDTCQPISTAPATITASGVYCLTADISYAAASGTAITINARHVVLDLSGHTLTNLSAGTGTQATGILGNSPNVTIRNGNVIGFLTGILLHSTGSVVEGIRADQNRSTAIEVFGADSGFVGSVIRNNLIIHTGASALASSAVYGILMIGSGSRALNNDIIDTVTPAGGAAYGIAAVGNGVVVEGNRITDSLPPSTVDPSRGVYFGPGSSGMVVNNRISMMTNGLDLTAPVPYRDNLTIGVLTPYSGGLDAGNNQHF